MYRPRPRVYSEVESPDRNGRARIRSTQYDVPPAATSALKMFCSMFWVGSYATGGAGTGVADPPKVGVPGSTAAGMPGVYSASAGAVPTVDTRTMVASTATVRRATVAKRVCGRMSGGTTELAMLCTFPVGCFERPEARRPHGVDAAGRWAARTRMIVPMADRWSGR